MVSCDGLERLISSDHILHVWPSNPVGTGVAAARRFSAKLEQLIRVSVGQRVEQHRFDSGEDDRGRADGDRDGTKGDGGYRRSTAEGSERKPHKKKRSHECERGTHECVRYLAKERAAFNAAS